MSAAKGDDLRDVRSVAHQPAVQCLKIIAQRLQLFRRNHLSCRRYRSFRRYCRYWRYWRYRNGVSARGHLAR